MQYQSYELDKQIFQIYTRAIGNLSGGKYSKFTYIKDNKIKEINISEIETIIESFCIDNKYLSYEEICYANIILLYSISLKYFPKDFECNSNLSFLLQNFVIMRKYILLFLELLYRLYQQSLKDHDNKSADRMKFCFYSCFNYIIQVRKQNLVPNENLMIIINKFLKSFSEEEKINNEIKIIDEKKEINEINILNKKEDNEIKIMNEKNEIIDDKFEIKITEENLYIYNNFSSMKFYNEKYIVKKVNDLQTEKFLVKYNGIVNMVLPIIRFWKNKKEKIDTIFMSQKQIYIKLSLEYKNFIEHLDIKKLNKKNILYSCLNIFIFMRNSKIFEELEEVINIMENIFYIFLTNK